MELSTTTALSLKDPITLDELRAQLDTFEKSAGPGAVCTARITARKLTLNGHSDGVVQDPGA